MLPLVNYLLMVRNLRLVLVFIIRAVGKAFYINGNTTESYNLFRFDMIADDKLRFSLHNRSVVFNSTAEINVNSDSNSGKNYISIGNSVSPTAWQIGVNKEVSDNLKIYSGGDKLTSGQVVFEVLSGGGLKAFNLKVADNDVDAGNLGVQVNEIYRTSTGEIRIKI
jgi:hypothetical protein